MHMVEAGDAFIKGAANPQSERVSANDTAEASAAVKADAMNMFMEERRRASLMVVVWRCVIMHRVQVLL